VTGVDIDAEACNGDTALTHPPAVNFNTMSPMILPSSNGLRIRAILPNKPTDPNGLVLSAWAQGFMSGAIVIMACITIANMRKGVLLHKLILVEVLITVPTFP
jgi:hypothetical protein